MIAFMLASTVLVAVLSAAGWHATQRWFPSWSLTCLWYAACVNLAAGWAGFIPLVVVRRRRPDYLPQAAMGGMALRILIVGVALLAMLMFSSMDSVACSVWMLVFYLSLLALETAMAVRLVRKADRS